MSEPVTITITTDDLRKQFSVILKAYKIRAVLFQIQEEKYRVIRAQSFEEAAALRDKEKALQGKLDEVTKEMADIYDIYFPEESKNIESFLP